MLVDKKKQLIDKVAEETGFTKKDIIKTIDVYYRTIFNSIRDGNKVAVKGFGTFTVYNRAATQRRNPQTGAIIDVPEKAAIKFTPGKVLKKALQYHTTPQ
jgi:DNA-binding protein HU-beta